MSDYQEIFFKVDAWLSQIIEVVKKDLKQEHIKQDKVFCKKYFLGKGVTQISVEEMIPAYKAEISSGNVGLAEFIASRWLLKNTDIYGFFEKKLSKINPDFDELKSLDSTFAQNLKNEAQEEFDPVRLYLFCVLNEVAFSNEIFNELKENAVTATQKSATENAMRAEKEGIEAIEKRHEREMRALLDRFEKKFTGMERKYVRDTEMLKNQIRVLSRKIEEASKVEHAL